MPIVFHLATENWRVGAASPRISQLPNGKRREGERVGPGFQLANEKRPLCRSFLICQLGILDTGVAFVYNFLNKHGKGESPVSQAVQQSESTISAVLEQLIKRNGKNLKEIAAETEIPYHTLYNICSRESSRTSLRTLKTLADYFGEDLSIFLGFEGYKRPVRLSSKEERLLKQYRGLSDAAQDRVDGTIEDAMANPKNRRKGHQDAV